MPRFKTLSGEDVVKILVALGFEVASQRGSHVKLRRITADGLKQTLTIPQHHELDRGTIRAIYRQTLRYVSEDELHPYFYTN